MNQKGIATFMKAERGFTHLVLIITTLLLLAGIGIAVYLTQFTQIFKPKATGNGVCSANSVASFKDCLGIPIGSDINRNTEGWKIRNGDVNTIEEIGRAS